MIDLDATIAAETAGEPIEVVIGGESYYVSPEMPWDTAALIGSSKPHDAFASIVLDESRAGAFADAMLKDRPSWKQISARFNAIYATGESAAS